MGAPTRSSEMRPTDAECTNHDGTGTASQEFAALCLIEHRCSPADFTRPRPADPHRAASMLPLSTPLSRAFPICRLAHLLARDLGLLWIEIAAAAAARASMLGKLFHDDLSAECRPLADHIVQLHNGD